MPQLSPSQRCKIEALKALKFGVTEISEQTGILKCTVSRELSRNSKNGRYDATKAEKLSLGRCQRGAYKLKGVVLEKVEEMLGNRYSPEQISGRLEQQKESGVSPETIYQHVYREKKAGGTLYKFLRFGHKKRRKRLAKRDKRGIIPNKTMISERPAEVEAKERFGDWEGDTIVGGNHQGVIVTLVDRKAKHTLMGQSENKTAAAVEKVVVDLLKNTPLPKETIIPATSTFVDYLVTGKRLELKAYYELQSDLLPYKLDNFKMFISRTSPKLLSEALIKTNSEFANLLYQLMTSIPGDKKRADLMIERIEKKKQALEWRWLLAKAQALKDR